MTVRHTSMVGHGRETFTLTRVSPDRQVLVLLDVQHELQAVAHPSVGGDEWRAAVDSCIERVTLPIASEHLKTEKVTLKGCLSNLR